MPNRPAEYNRQVVTGASIEGTLRAQPEKKTNETHEGTRVGSQLI
jgi:hypothetical protein